MKIFNKALALLISTLIASTATPALAASIGSVKENPTIGEDTVQAVSTKYAESGIGTANTQVYLTVDNYEVIVSVPTIVTISGVPDNDGYYKGYYSVNISGDFAGNELISVIPREEEFSLVQRGKNDIQASISQDKTTWSYEDVANGEGNATGIVKAQGLTAGSWAGGFTEEITMKKSPIPPGYVTLYKYDISATSADDVAAYYCVPKKNTSPISGTYGLRSLSLEDDDNYVDVDGTRYYISTDDLLVIMGEGKMKNEVCTLMQADNITVPGKVIINDGVTNISLNAFKDCANLTSIKMPSSLESIGNSAFFGCTALKEIVIPDSVISIGSNAFRGCSSLTDAYVGNNAALISDCCFYDCTSLTNINIGEKVKAINSNAFRNCPLTYVNFLGTTDDWAQIAFNYDYSNPAMMAGDLYIKGVLLENATLTEVKKISGNAFRNLKSLQSIALPNTLTTIYSSAFYGCTALQEITIPDSVTAIDGNIFYGCTSLTKATIGNSVSTISGSCFDGCTSLEEITIGRSVKAINANAFRKCPLTYVNFLGTADDWAQIVHDYDYSNPAMIAGDLYINGVLFEHGVMTEATKITKNAFRNLKSLKSITLPDTVTSIGNAAFYGSTALEGIVIPDDVTTIGTNAFNGCTSLATATIGNSVAAIPAGCFDGCVSLEGITIPDSVTSIGDNAFHGCSSFESLMLGDGIKSIGSNAFGACPNISYVNFLGTVDEWVQISFYHNGSNSFIGQSCPHIIAGDLYINGELLTDAVITNATTIKPYAFQGVKSLESVIIPDSVASIGGCAFAGCTALQEITIPDSVTSIGNSALYECSSLTDATIGNSVVSIPNGCFTGCTALENLTIGSSVTSVGEKVFDRCPNISYVNYLGSVDDWAQISFYHDGTNPFAGQSCPHIIAGDLHINGELLTDVVITNATAIKPYTFEQLNHINTVLLPDTVTSIGTKAFYYPTLYNTENEIIYLRKPFYCQSQDVADLLVDGTNCNFTRTNIIVDANKF